MIIRWFKYRRLELKGMVYIGWLAYLLICVVYLFNTWLR